MVKPRRVKPINMTDTIHHTNYLYTTQLSSEKVRLHKDSWIFIVFGETIYSVLWVRWNCDLREHWILKNTTANLYSSIWLFLALVVLWSHFNRILCSFLKVGHAYTEPASAFMETGLYDICTALQTGDETVQRRTSSVSFTPALAKFTNRMKMTALS